VVSEISQVLNDMGPPANAPMRNVRFCLQAAATRSGNFKEVPILVVARTGNYFRLFLPLGALTRPVVTFLYSFSDVWT
jgi:hypothetical protein